MRTVLYKSFEASLVGDNKVEGYASTFGNIDRADDIVERGAFAKSLSTGKPVRFLKDHDPTKAIGKVERISEDTKGLHFLASFSKNSVAQETRQDLKDGVLDSFSIGYRPILTKSDNINGRRVTRLKEIALHEISVVTFPCNEQAVLTAVKASGQLTDDHAQLVQKFAAFLLEEQATKSEADVLGQVEELLVKAGARHSAADKTRLVAIRDAIGGLLDDGDGDDDEDQEDGDEDDGSEDDDELEKAVADALLKLKLDTLSRALRG